MEKKIQKTFIDEGLGFPVVLLNVPMIKIRGKWTPDINYNALSKMVLLALSEKPVKLSGDEIRFVRQHFEMTLAEFAERFGVSHAAVIKWEKCKEEPTKMSWATEKDLRLFIVYSLLNKPSKLRNLYELLEKEKAESKRKIKLDLSQTAA